MYLLAMILASVLLSNIDVGGQIEACFQNFAAGLILAAGKSIFIIILINLISFYSLLYCIII